MENNTRLCNDILNSSPSSVSAVVVVAVMAIVSVVAAEIILSGNISFAIQDWEMAKTHTSSRAAYDKIFYFAPLCIV